MNNTKILIVEDDPMVRRLILTTLKVHDYRCLTAGSGKEALMAVSSHDPDIILLDLGLPDMDGVEIIKTVRAWSAMPIIVISARGEDSDKIGALDAGADDYLTKPFSVDEMLARIRVTERRLEIMRAAGESSPIFVNGTLEIDFKGGCVSVGGKEVHLTPIEYKLLCLLAKNEGKVLTHTFLTQKIWGTSWESDLASLRVFMATLRKKLEAAGVKGIIQTHIGVGYRMIKVSN